MKVLIVPDKFKGSLPSKEVATALARGWHKGRPGDHIEVIPMSDGGDGFGEVIASLTAAKKRSAITVNANHEKCSAPWWFKADTGTAIVESARTVGLSMLLPARHHPFALDTRGLGVLLAKIAARGVSRFLIGLGGSATNDCGFGMARALGWEFLDQKRKPLQRWTDLNSLVFLRPPQPRRRFAEMVIASDVQNPLLGPHGATRIYGPQKGLSPADIRFAEGAITRLAIVTKDTIGEDFSERPGAGAAGGLGFACMAFLGGRAEAGFDLFAKYSNLAKRLRNADLVLTGEGEIDASTAMGKGAGSLARLCRRAGIPCLGFTGSFDRKACPPDHLFDRVFALTEITTLGEAKSHPTSWLEHLAREAAISMNDSKSLSVKE